MSDHANQTLPNLPFFIAKRLAQIREHQEMMRQSALTKRTAAHVPSADAAGKSKIENAFCIPLQTDRKVQFFRRSSQKSFERMAKQSFPRAIHKPQIMLIIKCKNRHI